MKNNTLSHCLNCMTFVINMNGVCNKCKKQICNIKSPKKFD